MKTSFCPWLALAAATSLAAPASASLFITEFLADPLALGDSEGEYFEVFNTGPAIAVSTLAIADDDSDSVTFTDSTAVIGTNEFFVFGNSDQPYVDQVYSGFTLANGGDEIVVLQDGAELARVTYTDGDDFGDGIAAVLAEIASGSSVVGPDGGTDFFAEIADNDTLFTDDIGSPGSAGSTIVPEPASLGLLALGGVALLGRRRNQNIA